MPGLTPKFTRAEVAENLRISERTLRRLLVRIPGLAPIKTGRTSLFTEQDIELIEAALRGQSASRGGLSALGNRRSLSPISAQDLVRARLAYNKLLALTTPAARKNAARRVK